MGSKPKDLHSALRNIASYFTIIVSRKDREYRAWRGRSRMKALVVGGAGSVKPLSGASF